jgi:hypothetical protein
MRRAHLAALGVLLSGVVVAAFYYRPIDSTPPERPREVQEVELPDPPDPYSGNPDDDLPRAPASLEKGRNPLRFPTYQVPPDRRPDLTAHKRQNPLE